MRKPFNIFHVKIDRITLDDLFTVAKQFLSSETIHTIVTPNPEIVLKAEKDQLYREAINSADIRIPDGEGLVLASRLLKTPIKERVTGVDFLYKLLRYATKHHHTVYILLHENGITNATSLRAYLEKTFTELSATCQDVSMSYMQSGYIIDDINTIKPDILIVTFGAPIQEMWLQKNKSKLKGVHIVFAVGGAFDMLTGVIVRAPRFIRTLKLEWLWRIFLQPEHRLKRLKRIFNAVVIFGIKVLILKFRTLFVYRNNVLAFIYKNKNQILIVHKKGYSDEKFVRGGRWALPQGGVEHREPLEHAVRREIKEETGISTIGKVTKSKQKNRYSWIPYYRNIYSNRYAGQRQTAFFLEFTGTSEEIRLNFIGNENFDLYKWVSQKELLNKLEPSRRSYANRLMLEFNKRLVYKKDT